MFGAAAVGVGVGPSFQKGWVPTMDPKCRLWLPAWRGVEYADPAELLEDGDCEDAGVGSWNSLDSVLTKETINPYAGVRLLRVTANVGSSVPSAYQIKTAIGKKYRLDCRIRSDGAQIPLIISGTVLWTGTTSTSWQHVNIEFTSFSQNLIFRFNHISATGVEYIELDEASLKLTNSNLVSAWRDQSPYGRDVLQTSENGKPSWSPTGGPNGRPCITFDGISEYLKGTWTQPQPFTRFMVVKPSVSDDTTGTLADGGTKDSSINYVVADDRIATYAGAYLGGPSGVDSTLWHYISTIENGAASSTVVDRTLSASGNVGTTAPNGLTLGIRGDGITDPGDCELSEVIEFNGALSPLQIAQIESYIKGWSRL